jgi:phospholipid/cholesterol/gamma-HCH transport system substrate-binding protein
MKKMTKELLVGSLVLLVVVLLLAFGWLMGALRPFSNQVTFNVLYSFAGGVEVGSPVRVSGVKVGKVERIEFLATGGALSEVGATLKLLVSVTKTASAAVRKDSRFYVNMAGIIGERYIEISPGSTASPTLEAGSTVRGVDPPRIDQLLSQGYGVFGRIQELLEQNEDSAAEFLKEVNSLLKDANHFLKGADRKKIFALIDNLHEITADLKTVTRGMNDPQTKEAFHLMLDLIHRAHDVDKPAIKKFFQEEGIRARIF